MSYSYAKRSFPRRKRPSGGGAGGWLAVMVLAVALGGLWWAKGLPKTEKTPEDITIIPSSALINNSEPEESTVPQAREEEEISLTLHLEGFTLWGVQKGIYGTLEAAQQAAGEMELLFQAEDGCRVIESVWGEKTRAQSRGEVISADNYAAQLTARGLNLKLTGSREKLEAVESAARSWESILKELLEAQNLLEEGGMSQATAQRYALAVQKELEAAAEAVPEETEALRGMKSALEDTKAAMEEIVGANAKEKVDFPEIFRYNVGISYRIYNHYLEELLTSS